MLRSSAVAAGALILATSACGSTGVSAPPLQASLARTFANLYVLAQTEQGNPAPGDLHARTSCQKGTPASRQQGAGSDWVCAVTFLVAGPATPVTAVYDVDVKTDGCYAADGDGPASVNGSQTITGRGGEQRVNPLRRIDGCFDIG